MVKRILVMVAVVVAGFLLYRAYLHYRGTSAADTGAIHREDAGLSSSAPGEEPAVPKPRPIVATQPTTTNVAAPVSDTLAADAPNGAAFSGSGKFQVYRQGNLTWRVDTESGTSCVLFATMEEWQKPIVYIHGCNSNN